uniref:NR LBD domain-containing protein n=1 Tax=Steinernema glaseri TaxID=37863 RepID=A0A1I7Z9G9_9BILA
MRRYVASQDTYRLLLREKLLRNGIDETFALLVQMALNFNDRLHPCLSLSQMKIEIYKIFRLSNSQLARKRSTVILNLERFHMNSYKGDALCRFGTNWKQHTDATAGLLKRETVQRLATGDRDASLAQMLMSHISRLLDRETVQRLATGDRDASLAQMLMSRLIDVR